jgi:hypothetical protein
VAYIVYVAGAAKYFWPRKPGKSNLGEFPTARSFQIA